MSEHEGSEEGGEGLSAAEREALCFCADVHDCLTAADSDILKAACETHAKRVERILADRLAEVQAEQAAMWEPIVRTATWRLAIAEGERDEIADRLSALLCDLTGGLMSNTGYSVRTMVHAIEAEFEKHATTDLADALARVDSAETERDKWMKSRRYWKGRAESAETQLDELRGQHAEAEWLLRMTYDARDRAERKVEAAEALVVESLARPQPGYVSALALRAALANPSAAQREAEVEPQACQECGKSATACGRSRDYCCGACSRNRFGTHYPIQVVPLCSCGHSVHLHDNESDPPLCLTCGGFDKCDAITFCGSDVADRVRRALANPSAAQREAEVGARATVTFPAHHLVGADLGMTCINCGNHTALSAPCIPARDYPLATDEAEVPR